MKQRLIIRSDALPQGLQGELAQLQAILERKYGPAVHTVGIMLGNLTNVCSMVKADLTPEEREVAHARSVDVCNDVMHLLGRLLVVNKADVLAVAAAYADLATRAQEEILGADVLDAAKDEAAGAIAKAAMP